MERLNCSELVCNKQKDKEEEKPPMSIVKIFKYIQIL